MRGEVIVGYDGRAPALDAMVLGRTLATLTGAPLSIAIALPYDPMIAELDSYDEVVHKDAVTLLDRARPLLDGVEFELHAWGGDSPTRMLHDLAERVDAAAIVLGSTHRGALGALLPGSVAERLLAGAPCAVAVAPRGYAALGSPRIESIGVGFDGSEEADGALSLAAELAARSGAGVRLIAVAEPPMLGSPEAAWMAAAALAGEDPELAAKRERGLNEAAREAVAALPEGVRGTEETIAGDPATVLLERTANLDLLIVGSRRYGPVRRVLLGTVSGRVMRTASCPVLAVPRGAGGDARG